MKALVTMGCLTLAASAWAAPPPAAPKTAPQTAPERERRAEGSNDSTANAKIINTEGKEVGEATLTQAAKGVVIHVRLFRMPEGEHAIHIHEVGQCPLGVRPKVVGLAQELGDGPETGVRIGRRLVRHGKALREKPPR